MQEYEKDLKHYDRYLKRLVDFAKGFGIKVIYGNPNADGGIYVPLRRKIVLEKDLEQTTEISTLLHELGHVIDDTIREGVRAEEVNGAYSRIYKKNKASKKDKQIVFSCEKRAWRYGKSIAKLLKIRLGKWYDKEKEDCLRSYTI